MILLQEFGISVFKDKGVLRIRLRKRFNDEKKARHFCDVLSDMSVPYILTRDSKNRLKVLVENRRFLIKLFNNCSLEGLSDFNKHKVKFFREYFLMVN